LFINAVDEVTRERGQSFLTDDHRSRIVLAYRAFKPEPGFASVATLEEIRSKDANLSLPLYVSPAGPTDGGRDGVDLGKALEAWLQSSAAVRSSLADILSDK
jgi:type I restriction enzyme M protein